MMKALQRELDNCRKRIDDLKKAVQNMYIDKAKGIISEREYTDFRDSFQKELLLCQERIGEFEQQRDSMEQKMRDNRSKTEVMKAYANIEKLDRDMIDKMVDYIEIGRLENKQHRDDLPPITIYWKF